MSEQAKARQEACCNASETEYFGARPKIDTLMQRHNFCAGFYRGYAAALAAAPAQSGVRQFTDDERQFTKKPVTIQAIQWTGRNLREVIAFTDGPPDTRSAHAGMAWDAYVDLVARDGLKIYTLEGKMSAAVGDWIIKGVQGEHYPCKDEIFRLTYEPADDHAS